MAHDIATKLESYEMWRPRLVFDIAPSKKHWYEFYDVSLKNAGGSPAYNISCVFNPDIPYSDNSSLATLPIFHNLNHLIHGEEIAFYFNNSNRFLNDDNFPKQTVVTMNYQDALGHSLSNESRVDLEKYKGILYVENRGLNEIAKELGRIERTLSSIRRGGILVRTAEDTQIRNPDNTQEINNQQERRE
jgi:hypothetical protein